MIEQDLYARLTQDDAVNDIVSTRVYPLFMPQGVILPAITYTRISTVQTYSVNGFSGLSNPTIQIDAWAKSYNGAITLAAAIRGAMVDNEDFKCVESGARDLFEPDTAIYRHSIDYSIWV